MIANTEKRRSGGWNAEGEQASRLFNAKAEIHGQEARATAAANPPSHFVLWRDSLLCATLRTSKHAKLRNEPDSK
jgi:hypothetical protein